MRASTCHSLSALALGIACALLPLAASAGATIVINNINAAGVGFNDTTPAAPVGGNTGTTLGQQRLIAFSHAANIWGSTLDSAVPITINARFTPLTCTATGAVLGSAGATSVYGSAPGMPISDSWYGAALANKLYGADLDPTIADINANFNSNLGNVGCLTGTSFYLGLDGNHGTNIDFVVTLLHEMGHGLGFQTFTSGSTGVQFAGYPSAADHFLLDNSTGKLWYQMTNVERVASAVGVNKLVWTGAQVTASVPEVLGGTPRLLVNSPAGIAGTYAVGTADFGPTLTASGLTGDVVIGVDSGGGGLTDGCAPISNVVAGKLALVDRGVCSFTIKVKNAQNAGAIGVLVAENVVAALTGLGGTDATITIPSVRISLASGNLIKAAGNTVNATLGVNTNVRAGADGQGRALMFTPAPFQSGSSVSHWDTTATRNQLMEPSISADLTHSVDVPEDLTRAQLRDIGWYPDRDLDGVPDDEGDACPDTRIRGGNVVIDSCDSGVANAVFQNGCSIMDEVAKCEAAAVTHEGFTACVTQYSNALRKDLITNKQKASIQRCAAKAAIP
ncbi:PA domain-containing protein [Lysobacter sp. Root494]|uniref:PA domain-containing protein n=1 Tax=Lysobacter sp. Root494 TaxID=1736549 RepID=UPI000700083A|nr:PA domain-containing protein [Lysobacter sp. Root494]KQY52218.1 hypothetical protein ASD14_06130 [Lysobacter sp. Root494]